MQAQFHSHTDDTDSLQTVSEVLHWSEIFSDQLLIFYKPVFTAQGAEKKNPNTTVLTEVIPSGLVVWDMEQG